jgi:pimeloyl-ACP methyl ester carboxylesterase
MTGDATIQNRTASGSAPAERFRPAEEAVWTHHGLAPRERFVTLDDPRTRLRVLEVGSGRPIVMVHGTVGPGGWPSLIEAMGGSGRFIVLDRPGWGGSEPLDIPGPAYRRVAADVLRGVVDALGLDRVVVVGGSIGDVWAMSFAERHPARVDGSSCWGPARSSARFGRPDSSGCLPRRSVPWSSVCR